MLSDAGIQVILDHHALPGVQTGDSSFTGKYVSSAPFDIVFTTQTALVAQNTLNSM